MISYRDKDGNEIDAKTWGELFEDVNYRVIGIDTLPDGTKLSTVWLGINHMGDFFETALISDDDIEVFMRYPDKELALRSHKIILKKMLDDKDKEDSEIKEFNDELEKIDEEK